jgi:hypothetical protein
MPPGLQKPVSPRQFEATNRINLETNSLVHLSFNARTRSLAQTPIVKRARISAPGRDSRRDAANLEYPVTDTAAHKWEEAQVT